MAGFLNFLGSGDNGAGLMRKTQMDQQGAVNKATGKVNSIFSSFGPEFYAKAMKNYQNVLMPGVQEQAQGAEQNLGYSLARKGLTDSSSATRLGESLAKSVNTEKQNVVNTAQGQVNQLKQGQGQQQAGLIQEASSANFPAQAAQSAIGTAREFQAPGWFQGVGQTIGNWANTYLANQNRGTYGSSFSTPRNNLALSGGWDSPGAASLATTSTIA